MWIVVTFLSTSYYFNGVPQLIYRDRLYLNARKVAYTPKNVKKSFEATGIWPLNPWKVTLAQPQPAIDCCAIQSPSRATAPRIIPVPLTPCAPRQFSRLARELQAELKKSRDEIDIDSLTLGIQKFGSAYKSAKVDLDIERFQKQHYTQAGPSQRPIQDCKQLKFISPITSEYAQILMDERNAKEAAAAEKKIRAAERKAAAEAKKAAKEETASCQKYEKGKQVAIADEPETIEILASTLGG